MKTKAAPAAKLTHPWSSKALLIKAQRYSQEMFEYAPGDWKFGLNSTFVLEFLARATLAKISPTLLAESKDWNNVYFSLGFTPTASKFIPRSIDISSVFSRLREIIPSFTTEQEGFAARHLNRRNEELHTGSNPFDGVKVDWLGPFYQTCEVLLDSLGEKMEILTGPEIAKVAATVIAASRDESAKAVVKAIAAHRTVWEAKDAKEKAKSTRQATTWAIRQLGHRASCPSCGNDALLTGTPVSGPVRKLDGDLIVEAQQYLPTKFECIACQLKISGFSQLSACGLGDQYTSTSTYDAADYFAPEDQHPGFDDDNNEYGMP